MTTLIQQAMNRLQPAPFPELSARLGVWIRELSGTVNPADYFQHPSAVPFLLLPYWLEGHLNTTPDPKFQEDLIFSSINAYYFSRMIDDVMDGDAGADASLLPMLGLFHLNFQSPYQTYFPHDHPFWSFLADNWLHQAEKTILDHHLSDIDETAFRQIVSQKISAIKIPLGAVCYRHQRQDLLPHWSQFVDLFGCWHMMLNDLTGWNKDLKHGNWTYLLCEARRQHPGSLAAWIFAEGIRWAMEKLSGWMADMQRLAVDVPLLLEYLQMRDMALHEQHQKMMQGLKAAAALAKLDQKNPPSGGV